MSTAELVLLVTGGRGYGRILPNALPVAKRHAFAERALLRKTLASIHRETPIKLLVCGDATGADQYALAWAYAEQVPVESYAARWRDLNNVYDPSAGPRRNAKMVAYVADFKLPKLCLAFPGGAGTAGCVKLARKAGIPIREVQEVLW